MQWCRIGLGFGRAGGHAGRIADKPTAASDKNPFYKDEQFVWALKWTHSHLFGMGMIFIFSGGLNLLLDVGATFRTGLIVLPFAGIWIDIAATWLKGVVSPVFSGSASPGAGASARCSLMSPREPFGEMWIEPRGLRWA